MTGPSYKDILNEKLGNCIMIFMHSSCIKILHATRDQNSTVLIKTKQHKHASLISINPYCNPTENLYIKKK